ncbi:hypothetical protein ECC02_000660 [Trypanosoma cruzi]|uniref:Endonuclease-reverse transcriptase n=1 Tax=Trypanosoma cruzi TaxID=5693 RepID=A0A7J6YHQ1_TRYCR|nr:hypothetical protein ECC02_000660 [Trypanosoma cruzi]
MDFGLGNEPAQATRSTNRNVSSPDVAAYRVLRITHWQSTPYMDSDHRLISYSVGMDDGIPRLANTLPRREKATFAMRKADWHASTSLCETLPATASAWLDVRSGILRAAERHIPRGSRDSPKQSGQTKWNKPSPPQKQHTKHTHRLTRRQPASSRMYPKKGRNKIKPYAGTSLRFWKPVWKNLELHPVQAGDIFAVWRRRTLRSKRHVPHHSRDRLRPVGTHRFVRGAGVRQAGSKAPAGTTHHKHHHNQKHQQHCRPWGDVDQLTHAVREGRHFMA